MHTCRKMIVLALVVTACAGCSSIKVSKVTDADSAPGIRYALPMTFLHVHSDPEGKAGFVVDTVHLPDGANTYAIDAASYFASHTLTVDLSEGLLDKVTWVGTQSVVADAIKAGSEIVAKDVERRTKQKDKAEAAVKKARIELATRQKDLKFAELELQSARAAVVDASSPTAREQAAIRTAELEVYKQRLEVKFAEEQLVNAEADFSEVQSVFNQPGSAMAWGPVIYELRDTYSARNTNGTVQLVAVSWPQDGKSQMEFAVVSQPSASAAACPQPLTPDPPPAIAFVKGRAELRIEFTGNIGKVIKNHTDLIRVGDEDWVVGNRAPDIAPTGIRSVKAVFKKSLDPGRYELKITYEYSSDLENTAIVPFSVKK